MIILGPPGSGKGTQASLIEAEFKLKHISTGSILRQIINKGNELGKKIKDIIKEGKLVSDEVINQVVRRCFEEKNYLIYGFVLDGFPRNINQANFFSQLLEKNSLSVDKVFYLDLPLEETIFRLTNRRECPNCSERYHLKLKVPKREGICERCGTKLIQREDDEVSVIKERLTIYKEQDSLLCEYYQKKNTLIKIDAAKPVEKVFLDLCQYM